MKERIRSLLFMAVILLFSVVNLIMPVKGFSARENRYLQGFPDLNWNNVLSGKFGEEFEKYTTDQFVGRNGWISLKTLTDLFMLKKDNGRVYFGKDNYLFNVYKDLDMEQYNKNIAYINSFINDIKRYNSDIIINALLVPDKYTALGDMLPIYAPVVDEEKIIKNLLSKLDNRMNIVSLIEVLKGRSDEEIYYKTDHHWTSRGAYYAYRHYMGLMGIKPMEEDEFIIHKISEDFLGSNYRKSNLYLGTPDNIYMYKPKSDNNLNIIINNQNKQSNLYDESFLNKADKYSYFLGGDKALIEINTSIKNGKTLMIFKDSFANSFIPFLTAHYEKIVVIDTRYFRGGIGELISSSHINEILFLFNIQTFMQEKTMSVLTPINL